MKHLGIPFAIAVPASMRGGADGARPAAPGWRIGRLCGALAAGLLLLAFVLPEIGMAQTGWERYPANPVFEPGTEEADAAHPAVLFDGTAYHLWYTRNDDSRCSIGYARSADGLTWEQYPGNPVLRAGFGERWDGDFVSQPTVVHDGEIYRMWYAGYDGAAMRIGYATSADGATWEKDPANPVLVPGEDGAWDAAGVGSPAVVYDGEVYRMWYAGYDGAVMRIGYATSDDGVAWEKHSNPVLDPGTGEEWDAGGASSPAVVVRDGTYQMWYAGYDGAAMRIGYASSDDGVTWEKHSNPVLDPGTGGAWEAKGASDPAVLLVPNPERYRLWYTGYDGIRQRIGSATGQVSSTRGDISGNGQITAYDAMLILQYVVGLIDQLPAQQSGAGKNVQTPSRYSVSLPRISARAGERIQLPVRVQDATGLLAGGIRLQYDPTVLRAVEAVGSSALSGSHWQGNTGLPGEVRFAFVTLAPLRDGGDLAIFTFDVLSRAEEHLSPVVLADVDLNTAVPVEVRNGAVRVTPASTRLLPNYPNPFNPGTWIPYQLAAGARVRIRIYNAQGQLVRVLDGREQQAGLYRAEGEAVYWDGTDTAGQRVANGIYFYQLQAGRYLSEIAKMTFVK